ncbi:uncharacterized protein LOC132446069 [Gadus macrocephalus]|uniref:uncharacterized protein LOC132446069 n=1 Tax=Gadus macrocephalus TaxID=80720 RepID=UPI0028CB1D43|nr:uncharacterized protein LOC132446069 [Gadus macrocephalus]
MSEGTANAMAMGRFCVGAAFVVAIWMTEVSCSSFGGTNGRSGDEIGLGNVPQNDLADVIKMQQLIEALYQDHYIIEEYLKSAAKAYDHVTTDPLASNNVTQASDPVTQASDISEKLASSQSNNSMMPIHHNQNVSQTSLSKGCRKHYKAVGLQLLKAISNYKDVKEVSRESDQVNAKASSGTDPKAVGAALDAYDLAALNNVLTGQQHNGQETDYNECMP